MEKISKVTLKLLFPLTFLIAIFTLNLSTNYFDLKTPHNAINPTINTPIQNKTNTKQEILSTPKNKPKCDFFTGDWVPNPDGPYYTNNTCGVIQEHQNCMTYGRPDSEFMKWKWKPDECDLPVFDPTRFFKLVKDKSLAFVGDSVARNHMQSLLCLLSQVSLPKDVSTSPDENFKHYYFQDYNFTVSAFWSPYLVKTQENDPDSKPGENFKGLFLDEADESWTTQISQYNYLIISAAHWFFRPIIYREKAQLIGCRFCEKDGLKEYSLSYGYRSALRTAFRAIFENSKFTGNVYLRTFAPSHFEGGFWDHGGDCLRKKPFKRNETNLDGGSTDIYSAQIDEFSEARKMAQKRGLKFEIMDITQVMLMRPDGHPSSYWNSGPYNLPSSDCVHWCLPGPIVSWNDFLLQMFESDLHYEMEIATK